MSCVALRAGDEKPARLVAAEVMADHGRMRIQYLLRVEAAASEEHLHGADTRIGVAVVTVKAAAVESCAAPLAFAPAVSLVVMVALANVPDMTRGMSMPSRGAMLSAKIIGRIGSRLIASFDRQDCQPHRRVVAEVVTDQGCQGVENLLRLNSGTRARSLMASRAASVGASAIMLISSQFWPVG